MRLTLRTLLAYMDDVLDPADQEELGRKIESSAFATELIHRSRDAVRRLRLSAPEVLAGDEGDLHGGDHNLDANTAAEYLDSVLSPEEVADFERSCLEAGPNADMLLAEAASCHHVLTMVLGEPAEVDADLRQQMYALAQSHSQKLRLEPAHVSPQQTPLQQPAVAAAAAAPVGAPWSRIDADEASVPDYMLAAARADRRRRRGAMALVAGLILGGGAVWLFWPGGPVDTPSEVAEMGDVDELTQGVEIGSDADSADEVAATDDAAGAADNAAEGDAPPFVAPAAGVDEADEESVDETIAPAPGAATEAPAEIESPAPTASDEAAAAAAATATAEDEDEAVAVVTPEAPVGEDETQPGDAAAVAADDVETPVVDSPVAETPGDSSLGETRQQETANIDGATSPPAIPAPPGDLPAADVSDAGAAAMADAGAAAADAGSEGATAGAEALADAAEAAPEAPKQIGAYLGNNDVLLRFDSAAAAWVRLPPRSALTAGDRLMSLPTFRTHVVLADANTYLAGGAEIVLAAPGAASGDAPADFGLELPYGQLILNSGLNGNRIELAVGDQVRTIALGPSSSLAVEVRRLFEPGATGVRQSAPAEITWYLTSGTAEWGGPIEPTTAEAPAIWTTADGEDTAPAAIDALPEWIDSEPISDPERRARNTVDESLTMGEPVDTRLLELSDRTGLGRRTEVRALAAKSGAYVGQFDAVVKALGDINQRASWKEQIETLRQAVARDPAAADAIRQAFVTQRGEEAAGDLMEMLLGFDEQSIGVTREQVQQGALLRLIRWMDDDDLVYRILASHNVNLITGTNYLGGYRPEHTAQQRQRELRFYWDRLEKGELMPRK